MPLLSRFIRNPMTLKRIRRFKEVKRAYFSLWLLSGLFLISLFSELICNNVPLYVRFNDSSYFPIFSFYTEDEFTGTGLLTRPDYKKIADIPAFAENPDNYMIFPPVPFGPYESIEPASIEVSKKITASFTPVPIIGRVDILPNGEIERSLAFAPFVEKTEEEVQGTELSGYIELPEEVKAAVQRRFANQPASRFTHATDAFGEDRVQISLSTFTPRDAPPDTVRLTFRETGERAEPVKMRFDKEGALYSDPSNLWPHIPKADKAVVREFAVRRTQAPVDPIRLQIKGRNYIVHFIGMEVRFPYQPAEGHIMGIDGAGRDVLARILYGLRTSLTFGFLLVAGSMLIGIIAGALQGYYGGLIDITAQRLTEIWSALPFLYVMILMGSVYGRSFMLLLFCYGLFNWIGISYYIRAEFLRLRRLPFVEAAKCMGIPTWKVIFKHILPNGMIPVITFFPFSLVGAIGALAALDYLGFGLPPPTPSWGELLFQAQQYRWAWWLILYPSLALFTVMLLGVFVGEGVRNAYDPKRYIRLE